MDQTDDTLTRSEEELQVHTRSRVVGRVRLRKRIVTETIQVSVDVRREELEIIHEQVGDEAYDDAPLGGDTHTIVLSAEEPVVGVQVMPVERIHVLKALVSEDQEITADLRREQVEVEQTPPIAG